jgi:soluble lytic murein transglycosylase-like protein
MRGALVCLAAVTLLTAGSCTSGIAEPELADLAPSSSQELSLSPNPVGTSRPDGQSLERKVIRSMLFDSALRHHVHPALVMGLAWWESGWNPAAISSAGAIGVMQVMPATAEAAGPLLLHRKADVHDLADNIDLGTAILKANLDRYGNQLAKALVAYYAGPGAVADWNDLTADERRYVLGVYHVAIAFKEGNGPA